MKRNTSFGRVLKHDYPSFMFAMFPALLMILGLITYFTGWVPSKRPGGRPASPEFAAGMLIVAIALSVVFVWLLSARYARLRRIVAAGKEVDAKIVNLRYYKDRARVEFEYSWEGRTYVDRHAIMKTEETTELQPGDSLLVSVDPLKPSRAVPVELMCPRPTSGPGLRPGR